MGDNIDQNASSLCLWAVENIHGRQFKYDHPKTHNDTPRHQIFCDKNLQFVAVIQSSLMPCFTECLVRVSYQMACEHAIFGRV